MSKKRPREEDDTQALLAAIRRARECQQGLGAEPKGCRQAGGASGQQQYLPPPQACSGESGRVEKSAHKRYQAARKKEQRRKKAACLKELAARAEDGMSTVTAPGDVMEHDADVGLPGQDETWQAPTTHAPTSARVAARAPDGDTASEVEVPGQEEARAPEGPAASAARGEESLTDPGWGAGAGSLWSAPESAPLQHGHIGARHGYDRVPGPGRPPERDRSGTLPVRCQQGGGGGGASAEQELQPLLQRGCADAEEGAEHTGGQAMESVVEQERQRASLKQLEAHLVQLLEAAKPKHRIYGSQLQRLYKQTFGQEICPQVRTLNPTPYTLHPTPYTT